MLRGLKQFSLPELEEKVLKFWKENQIFEKSLAKNLPKRSTSHVKRFTFYEGPPTANGRPGIHHVLSRSFKDVILRFKSMAGFYVPRKAGWDTHGLPVEIEVEKSLRLKSKKEIEEYGVAKFNEKCRESVWKYKDEWEKLTERIGFWLDLKNPYITYENSYIESLWWIIKEIWKKKLLHKGHKVAPWCTRCGTGLSSHEMSLGYKKVLDTSVYVKFKLKTTNNEQRTTRLKNTYILSWTTTPWTLPGNVALAVGPKVEYGIFTNGKENLILAKARKNVLGDGWRETKTIVAKDLLGMEYEPLFKIKPLHSKASYKVYPADFVTTTEGTGIVHTAVMYGEDDYNLGKKVGLPQHHTVNEKGKFTEDVSELEGFYVKDKKTEEGIIDHLRSKNFLFRTEEYEHDYPFCWRCGTPLLYYARESWFITMSKLRKKLIAANNKINWIPTHIKSGRFGEWLREVKDWNFSRERYWGTPLPIWECKKCGEREVVGSFRELEKHLGKARNHYILVRHGEAENNLEKKVSGWPEKEKLHLTLFGRVEVEKLAKKLSKQKIDYIYSSDITRTKETEQILADVFRGEKVFFDKRLREINTGKFNGCHDAQYHSYFSSTIEKFTKRPPEGETLTELRKRLFEFLNETEKKHENKTIVIVSHEYPIWILGQIMSGWSNEEAVKEKDRRGEDFLETGGAEKVHYRKLPRDETGLADLHRPYIDEIKWTCSKCRGGETSRIKELADVWFDSGSMPFAQGHWPFEKGLLFPADYISEGVDQTRGWFYTLLAVAVLLGKGAPYKNVISLGHVLDKNGQKMSKSKGNVVDPWAMIQKYGVDVVRWYFYSVNPPGEPKKFDETDLGKVSRQIVSLLYNSFVFLNTYDYRTENIKSQILTSKSNILDQWVFARLNETTLGATKKLDEYDIPGAAKEIEEFVEDVSRWYIRRSRRRFQKPESDADYNNALGTLHFILIETSKLIAPFMPFFAEALYKSLEHKTGDKEHFSVHLENWPQISSKLKVESRKLLNEMEGVRRIASQVLAKRAESGIKVRQPLVLLKIRNPKSEIRKNEELLNILKDEVNVKSVVFDPKLKEDFVLDTNITHELKEEGWFREFVRMVQGLRQDAELEPKDVIVLSVQAPEELNFVLKKNEETLKKEVNTKSIEYNRNNKFTAELDTKLDNWPVWIGLRKPL